MPTHRSVTISLVSQYDFQPIPEILSPLSRKPLPISNRTITANIPIYSASQFWISYQCPLPPPPKPDGDETKFYYFKLFTPGRCILSWGVSEAEDWQGKVVCGFWDAGTDFEGKKVIEKRGLFFPNVDTPDACGGFEIRVFRAKARKREEVKYETYTDGGQRDSEMKVNTIGLKRKGERQRFYTYALVDPKDAPFVTFRYVFRTKERLSRIELGEEEAEDEGETCPASQTDLSTLDGSALLPASPTPRSTMDLATESPLIELRARTRRLSIPPRMMLQPGSTATKRPSPVKKEAHNNEDGSQSCHGGRGGSTDEQAYGKRAVKTPSPPSGTHNRFNVSPGTPPSQRKAASSGLFRSVVASALKRKEDRKR